MAAMQKLVQMVTMLPFPASLRSSVFRLCRRPRGHSRTRYLCWRALQGGHVAQTCRFSPSAPSRQWRPVANPSVGPAKRASLVPVKPAWLGWSPLTLAGVRLSVSGVKHRLLGQRRCSVAPQLRYSTRAPPPGGGPVADHVTLVEQQLCDEAKHQVCVWKPQGSGQVQGSGWVQVSGW